MIKEILELKSEGHKSSGKFSISSIGCCWRKKYLELKGLYKEEYTEKTQRAFQIGDLFHQQIIKELIEKCESSDIRIVAAECNIPEQKHISGRIDQLLSNIRTGEMFVADVKSCGDWTLKQVREGKVPEKYIQQVQLYLHFLHLKKGYIVFVGKHKNEIEEAEVDYDPLICKQLIQEIEDFYSNYVDKNIEPPLCDGGEWGCPVCFPLEDKK